jgi:hypothetical protein
MYPPSRYVPFRSALPLLTYSPRLASSVVWIRWIDVTYWIHLWYLAWILDRFVRVYARGSDRLLIRQSERSSSKLLICC